jgi:hypothetical protein
MALVQNTPNRESGSFLVSLGDPPFCLLRVSPPPILILLVRSVGLFHKKARSHRVLALERRLNCGLTLRAHDRDDYAACDDEQSAYEDCERWNLLECQPRDG